MDSHKNSLRTAADFPQTPAVVNFSAVIELPADGAKTRDSASTQ